MSQELVDIFEQIERSYFADGVVACATPKFRGKLTTLFKEITDFEAELQAEAQQGKEQQALKTARQLQKTLSHFFDKNADLHSRERALNQFLRQSRNAWFTKQEKMSAAGAVGGVSAFFGSLALIIATGGIALFGIGLVVAVSVAMGVIGAMLFAYVAHRVSANVQEQRGAKVRQVLASMLWLDSLETFVLARHRHFNPREQYNATTTRLRAKYGFGVSKSDPDLEQALQREDGHRVEAAPVVWSPPFSTLPGAKNVDLSLIEAVDIFDSGLHRGGPQ
jgi:hypothetical protein